MHCLDIGFRGLVAFALGGLDMYEDRTVATDRDADRAADRVQVVSVDRPHIGESKGLEQRAALKPEGLGRIAQARPDRSTARDS